MKKICFLLIMSTSIISFTATFAQTGGKASYYANSLHGRKMSNGQPYNRNNLTCAHKTLPFGTKIRVTNVRNGKSVIVNVTDRGPYARGRVIDLSYAAASQIDMIASGVIYVKLEILPKNIEIPYNKDNQGIEVSEVEYGYAGVCYKFIPEWEKTIEEKPKQIKRKVDTSLKQAPSSTSTKSQKKKDNKNQSTTQSQKTEEIKKENRWTNFFQRIKTGVNNIFD